MVTPDDKMTVPIEQLAFWAARCVRRVAKLVALPLERFETPEVQAFAHHEEQFVPAYRTVLLLRAAELARFCGQVGLTGCTPDMVRDNPFVIVLAIDQHLEVNSNED